LKSPVNIWKLRRFIKSRLGGNEPVIVHAHLTWPFIYVALASLFLNVRLFYTEHSTHNKRRKHKFFRWLDRLCYARYDRIICISQGVYQALARWVGPRLTSKLVVVPNGAKLYPLVERAAPANRKLSLVSVGSLQARKNFSTAIGAVALARECVAEYVIVGEGPERAALERLIAEHDLQSVVRLVGWSDVVNDYLVPADVQLIPSLWEGFGLVAVEGLSTGLPVIASDVDGLREVLADTGESVSLVSDSRSEQAWARAIMAMSHRLQPDNISAIATSSRSRAERFSLDRMVERYLAEYAGL
jgi:glycosyltransferase involved in cell wall biosynthesis